MTASLKKLHPQVASLVRAMQAGAKQLGFSITVSSGWRSREKQSQLYSQRSSLSYPVAPPGTSQHEYGLAVDLIAKPREAQSIIVSWWQQAGGSWSINDPIHFAVFSREAWSAMLGGAKPPAELAPQVQLQGPGFKVSSQQISQAVNLAAKGDTSVANALLRDPMVALTPDQTSQLKTLIVTPAAAPPGPSVTPPPAPPAPTTSRDITGPPSVIVGPSISRRH